jgi:hypothetical protein
MSIVDADRADVDIAETIESYRSRGAGLAWVVTPICRPENLGERLVGHGMKHQGESWAMALEVEGVEREIPEGVEVIKIDAGAIDDFVATSERG